MADCIQKQDPYTCCLQETHFRSRDTHKAKVRKWKQVFHTNGIKRQPEQQYLDKTDCKIKTAGRDKGGQNIIIKG